MFNDYVATKGDLRAVEEGMRFVFDPRMEFVFRNKSRIMNTSVVSYDSEFIFVWSIDSARTPLRIPHDLAVPGWWQSGWWAGAVSKGIERYLPSRNKKSVISGGLLTPFIELQREKRIHENPYTTRESYLATMVHEFGHVYFKGSVVKGELSAFCSEYYASSLFWPKHKRMLDELIKRTGRETAKMNERNDPHVFALLNARKFINRYPKTWSKRLLGQNYLGAQPWVG